MAVLRTVPKVLVQLSNAKYLIFEYIEYKDLEKYLKYEHREYKNKENTKLNFFLKKTTAIQLIGVSATKGAL